MKRGFLTSEKAKRALEKEYPAKRQAMCNTPPRDLAQSTTTSTMALAAATDVHADTHTSVISDHSQRSTTVVPPATVGATSEGSGGDAVMSSSDVEGEADSTVKSGTCRPVDGDNPTRVTDTDKKAPDADGDVDMQPIMADTEDEHERTTDEKKSNDKQLPVTDPKTDTDTDKKAPDGDGDVDMPPVIADGDDERTTGEKSNPTTDPNKSEAATASSKDAEPSTTANDDQNDDGPVHINGMYFISPNTDLHTVPSIAFGKHAASNIRERKRRAIFRVWPRDPNGKAIVPNETMRGGKVAPNGILSWGATLYDFYSIKPMPKNPYAITYLSGSRIAAALREIGEVEYAKDEFEWADKEDDPYEIPVANTGELVECYEIRARLFKAYSAVETKVDASTGGLDCFSSAHEGGEEQDTKKDKGGEKEGNDDEAEDENGDEAEDEMGDEAEDEMGDEAEDENCNEDEGENEDKDEDGNEGKDGNEDKNENEKSKPNEPEKRNYGISSILMSDRPLSSPFHPSHYPPPWPFIPFANPYPPVLLQERIPAHLLPKTLYVHDPYSLLNVDPCRETKDDKTPWTHMRPRAYLYELSLESSTLKAIEESEKEAEENERKKKRVLDVYRFLPTEEERARGEPAYEVALPTKPSALTRVEEAHLYLSPAGMLGEGNHSMVYKAEWELPRDLFVEPWMCHTCVHEQLMIQVHLLKWSGRWHEMMEQAGCKVSPDMEKPDGFKYEMPVPPDTDEEFDMERIILLKPPSDSKHAPSSASTSTPTSDSKGLTVFRVYCPGLRWQTPVDPSSRCSHFRYCAKYAVPRTSVFQVAAKLSIQHDAHLAREARNYQAFPDHFFQHWSGYNLIRPIHNPVPLHALVPQFYGYYVPVEEVALSIPDEIAVDVDMEKGTAEAPTEPADTDEVPAEEANQKGPPPYLSPILLLEHCGQPVDLSCLSEDDREECASLCLRFNNAGWLHESIAERNVLVQPGLPTQLPIERNVSESDAETRKSFRLIDFGRSKKISSPAAWETLRVGKGETETALKMVKIMHGAFL